MASEVLIGTITHYYDKLEVAVLTLYSSLSEGDQVHIVGHTTDLEQRVASMETNHQPVDFANPGDEVALKVTNRVRDGDKVYLQLNGSSE